jgi:uncharacterized protein YbjT (DUF2867 family)
VARVLIVGCGCRGRALGRALRRQGHAVRGTTRDRRRGPELEADGIEPWVGDPDRLGTLVLGLDGVTVACWLLGTASAAADALAALHGPRLRAFCERAVDTTVRGLVYERAGTVPAPLLAQGAEIARRAADTWEIPLRMVDADPANHREWLAAAQRGVGELLDVPGEPRALR